MIQKGYYPKETKRHLVTVQSSPFSIYSLAENGYNEHIPHSLEGWWQDMEREVQKTAALGTSHDNMERSAV